VRDICKCLRNKCSTGRPVGCYMVRLSPPETLARDLDLANLVANDTVSGSKATLGHCQLDRPTKSGIRIFSHIATLLVHNLLEVTTDFELLIRHPSHTRPRIALVNGAFCCLDIPPTFPALVALNFLFPFPHLSPTTTDRGAFIETGSISHQARGSFFSWLHIKETLIRHLRPPSRPFPPPASTASTRLYPIQA